MRAAALLVISLTLISPRPALATDQAAIERGRYIFVAADCVVCHTVDKGTPLAGGRPLKTPFGTFFAPNITPDPESGIGGWSEEDFHRALREGKGKDGEYLYPVFPFTSFTGMTDQDIADLYAYLMAQPPAAQSDKRNQAKFPFGFRILLSGWRLLFFREGPLEPEPGQSAEWNRGRYLTEAVGHCGECHSLRNALGAVETSRAMAGNPMGPDGQKAPNITPDPETGIGKWSLDDIEDLLDTGIKPNGDFVGSGMADVTDGTGKMTKSDRHAIAVYLKSLPPQRATGK